MLKCPQFCHKFKIFLSLLPVSSSSVPTSCGSKLGVFVDAVIAGDWKPGSFGKASGTPQAPKLSSSQNSLQPQPHMTAEGSLDVQTSEELQKMVFGWNDHQKASDRWDKNPKKLYEFLPHTREIRSVFIDKQDLSATLEIGLGCKPILPKLR